MVKSMLDLRMLESYCAEEAEQLEVPSLRFQFDVKASLTDHLTVVPPPQVKTSPSSTSTSCPKGVSPVPEVGRHRSKQELGSTVSLQVTSAWVSNMLEYRSHDGTSALWDQFFERSF